MSSSLLVSSISLVASFIYLSNIDRERFLRPSRKRGRERPVRKKIEGRDVPLERKHSPDITLANGIGTVVDTFKQRTQAKYDNTSYDKASFRQNK